MGNFNSPGGRRPTPQGAAPNARPNEAAGAGYPGAAVPGPQAYPNMFAGQRPELRGENLLPWRPMPRAIMPQMQKTYTIKNDVNLKKNSLKLVADPASPSRYILEFDFDASTDCKITVYFAATELENEHAKYAPREGEPEPPSKTFPKGLGQSFKGEPAGAFDASQFAEEELSYDTQLPRRYPIIVRLESVASDAAGSSSDAKPAVQSQSTFATMHKSDEGLWTCRVLKQKIQVGTRSFELQEIYGIDQGANGTSEAARADDLDEDGGRECVICMTDPRDTTVLPCRHMCMCNKCAKVLRLQSNKCPICRCNVERLLQIKVKGADKPDAPAAPAPTPSAPAAGAEAKAPSS